MPSSQLLVYVVRIGSPPYAACTEPFISQYCRRHGYDLHFSDSRHDRNRHPSWEKLLAFRRTEHDFVLLMDLDMVPLPDAPAIHPFLCRDKLNLAPLVPGRVARRRLARWNYPAELMQWNAGLIAVSRAMSPFLERIYHSASPQDAVWMEQGALNLAIHDCRVEVHSLAPVWNYWLRREWEPNSTNAHFLHPAGNKWRRVRNAQKICDHFSILSQV
jgi:hypothetical protein